MDKKNDAIIPMLKEFKKKAGKKIKLDKLIFFGSRATGKSKKNSDVDLLLISKKFKGKKHFKRSPLFYLIWDYPYDADILCLTPEELKKKMGQIGVVKQAVKEGIEI